MESAQHCDFSRIANFQRQQINHTEKDHCRCNNETDDDKLKAEISLSQKLIEDKILNEPDNDFEGAKSLRTLQNPVGLPDLISSTTASSFGLPSSDQMEQADVDISPALPKSDPPLIVQYGNSDVDERHFALDEVIIESNIGDTSGGGESGTDDDDSSSNEDESDSSEANEKLLPMKHEHVTYFADGITGPASFGTSYTHIDQTDDLEAEFDFILQSLDKESQDTYLERFAGRRDRYGFILSPIIETPSPTPSSLSGYSGLSCTSPDPLGAFRMSPGPGKTRHDIDLSSLRVKSPDWDAENNQTVPIYHARRVIVVPDGYTWDSPEELLSPTESGDWLSDDNGLCTPPVPDTSTNLAQFGKYLIGERRDPVSVIQELTEESDSDTTIDDDEDNESDNTVEGEYVVSNTEVTKPTENGEGEIKETDGRDAQDEIEEFNQTLALFELEEEILKVNDELNELKSKNKQFEDNVKQTGDAVPKSAYKEVNTTPSETRNETNEEVNIQVYSLESSLSDSYRGFGEALSKFNQAAEDGDYRVINDKFEVSTPIIRMDSKQTTTDCDSSVGSSDAEDEYSDSDSDRENDSPLFVAPKSSSCTISHEENNGEADDIEVSEVLTPCIELLELDDISPHLELSSSPLTSDEVADSDTDSDVDQRNDDRSPVSVRQYTSGDSDEISNETNLHILSEIKPMEYVDNPVNITIDPTDISHETAQKMLHNPTEESKTVIVSANSTLDSSDDSGAEKVPLFQYSTKVLTGNKSFDETDTETSVADVAQKDNEISVSVFTEKRPLLKNDQSATICFDHDISENSTHRQTYKPETGKMRMPLKVVSQADEFGVSNKDVTNQKKLEHFSEIDPVQMLSCEQDGHPCYYLENDQSKTPNKLTEDLKDVERLEITNGTLKTPQIAENTKTSFDTARVQNQNVTSKADAKKAEPLGNNKRKPNAPHKTAQTINLNPKRNGKSPAVKIKVGHLEGNNSTRSKVKRGFVHELLEMFDPSPRRREPVREKTVKQTEIPAPDTTVKQILKPNDDIVIKSINRMNGSLGFEINDPGEFETENNTMHDTLNFSAEQAGGNKVSVDVSDFGSTESENSFDNDNLKLYENHLRELEAMDTNIPDSSLDKLHLQVAQYKAKPPELSTRSKCIMQKIDPWISHPEQEINAHDTGLNMASDLRNSGQFVNKCTVTDRYERNVDEIQIFGAMEDHVVAENMTSKTTSKPENNSKEGRNSVKPKRIIKADEIKGKTPTSEKGLQNTYKTKQTNSAENNFSMKLLPPVERRNRADLELEGKPGPADLKLYDIDINEKAESDKYIHPSYERNETEIEIINISSGQRSADENWKAELQSYQSENDYPSDSQTHSDNSTCLEDGVVSRHCKQKGEESNVVCYEARSDTCNDTVSGDESSVKPFSRHFDYKSAWLGRQVTNYPAALPEVYDDRPRFQERVIPERRRSLHKTESSASNSDTDNKSSGILYDIISRIQSRFRQKAQLTSVGPTTAGSPISRSPYQPKQYESFGKSSQGLLTETAKPYSYLRAARRDIPEYLKPYEIKYPETLRRELSGPYCRTRGFNKQAEFEFENLGEVTSVQQNTEADKSYLLNYDTGAPRYIEYPFQRGERESRTKSPFQPLRSLSSDRDEKFDNSVSNILHTSPDFRKDTSDTDCTYYSVKTPLPFAKQWDSIKCEWKPITYSEANQAKRENNFVNVNRCSPLQPKSLRTDALTCKQENEFDKAHCSNGLAISETSRNKNENNGTLKSLCISISDTDCCESGKSYNVELSDDTLDDDRSVKMKNEFCHKKLGVKDPATIAANEVSYHSMAMNDVQLSEDGKSTNGDIHLHGINDIQLQGGTKNINSPHTSPGTTNKTNGQHTKDERKSPKAEHTPNNISVVIQTPGYQHVLENEKGKLTVWPYSEIENVDKLPVTIHRAKKGINLSVGKGMSESKMTVIQSAEHSSQMPENKMVKRYHSSSVLPGENGGDNIMKVHGDSEQSVLLQDSNGNALSEEELADVLPKIAETISKLDNTEAEEILPGITQSITKLKNGGNLVITTMTRRLDEDESVSSGRGSPDTAPSEGPVLSIDDLENSKLYLVRDSQGELFYVEDITEESQESAYFSSSRGSESESSPTLDRMSNLQTLGTSGIQGSTANEILSAMYGANGVQEINENEEEWSERTYEYDRSVPRRDSFKPQYMVEEPETLPRMNATNYAMAPYQMMNMPMVFDGGLAQSYSQMTQGTEDNMSMMSTQNASAGAAKTIERYTIEGEVFEYPIVPPPPPQLYIPPPPVVVPAPLPLVKVTVPPTMKDESTMVKEEPPQTEEAEQVIFKTVAHIHPKQKLPAPKKEVVKKEKKAYKVISSKSAEMEEQESHIRLEDIDYQYHSENVSKAEPRVAETQYFVRNTTNVEAPAIYRTEKKVELAKQADQTYKSQVQVKDTRQEHVEESSYSYDEMRAHMAQSGSDMRVVRGSYLIKNTLDDAYGYLDDNINMFDGKFELCKDNPLYKSEEDLYSKTERSEQSMKQEQRQRRQNQDLSYETVDKYSKTKNVKREAEKPKQTLTEMLLSRLVNVDSRHITQKIDVKHNSEDIYGDPRLLHADGQRAYGPFGTSNFDTVGEKVDLTMKEGKAFIVVTVTAERITPVDIEFNVWRKNRAIVTRTIQVDLLATEHRRRLYYKVMQEADGSSSSYKSGSSHETVLDSQKTLELFTKILDASEGEGDSEDIEVRTSCGRTRLPYSTGMDLLY